MKATAVTPPTTKEELVGCCVCGKKLAAPWGRNGPTGKDWVCGKRCQTSYDVAKHQQSNVGLKM